MEEVTEEREKRARITIQNGALIPPEGYNDIPELLDDLSAVTYISDSSLVNPDEPCVFIAEYHERFVRVPEGNEILYVQNRMPGPKKFKATDIAIALFWAFDEASDKNVLVAWDNWDNGTMYSLLWTTVSTEKWSTTPLGLHAVRMFKNVNAARAECPDGSDGRIIVLSRKYSKQWYAFEVHSPFNETHDSVEIVMRPDVLGKELGIPEHIRMPRPVWKKSLVDQDSPLNEICPSLSKEEWPDTVEGVTTPPQVLMIGVIPSYRRSIAVTGPSGLIIATYERIDNTNALRIYWRIFDYDYSSHIFKQKAKS